VCVNLTTELTVAIVSGGRHRCTRISNIPYSTTFDGRLECPPTQGTLPLLGFLHHE